MRTNIVIDDKLMAAVMAAGESANGELNPIFQARPIRIQEMSAAHFVKPDKAK